MIKPRPETSDLYSYDACQEALEGEMQQLLEDALQVGWSTEEVAVAFMEIGNRLFEALAQQRRLDFANAGCATDKA